MVAVVTGPGNGLNNTSLATLAGQTNNGAPNLGPTGEAIYVNTANGNLVVQDQDLELAAVGIDLDLTRTYNSQGYLNGDVGTGWQLSVERSVGDLIGTLNTAGSSVVRTDGDGSQSTFTYNTTLGLYVTTAGPGAYDTLAYGASTQQWTYTDASTQAVEVYNSTGQLESSRDANGNTDTYAYTGSLLTQVTDASGQITYLDYSGNNLTDVRVVSNGNTIKRTYYSYDSLNRLSKVTTDLTPTDVSIADNNTYITTYSYLGATQLLSGISQQSGLSSNVVAAASFTYVLTDGLYRLKTYTDALGNVTTFNYSQVSVPTTTTLSANSAVLSSTSPPYYTVKSGDTWTSIAQSIYGSSTAAVVAALTRAAGDPALSTGLEVVVPTKLYVSADAIYLQTDVTDPLGNDTTYLENAAGELTSVQRPSVNGTRLQTIYAYDSNGNLTSVTVDPTGLDRVTTYQYDSNGNVLQSQDADGNTVTSTYTSTNQLLTQTTYTTPAGTSTAPANPQTTRYVYDGSNLSYAISPDGRVTAYLYNAQGERITAASFMQALYDVSGLATTASPTLATMNTWAGAQTLTELQRVDYTYDFRGLLQTETQYTATDSLGNGIAAGSSEIQYVYNALGQLSQKILSPGSAITTLASGVGPTTVYTFDVFGRPTSVSALIDTTSAQTTTTYNEALNQVTTVFNQLTESPAPGDTQVDTYNADGELISSQVTSVSQGPSPTTTVSTTSYAYDADGRLRMTTDPDGVKTFILYDAAGREAATIDGNGALTQYVYNTADQVVQTIRYSSALSASTLATLVTAQGAPAAVSVATLVTSLASAPGRNAALDQITRSVFDAAGRLEYSIDGSGDVTQYVYDGAGQLTQQTQYANPVSIAASVGQVLPSALTITPDPGVDRVTRYFYDPDGLLAGKLDPDGYLTTYSYDDAGHLVSETAYANPTTAGLRATGTLASLIPTAVPTQDITTRYFFDAEGREVGVLDGDGYVTQTVYDAAGDVAQTIRYQNAVAYTAGETLAQLVAAATGTNHVTSYAYDGEQRLIQTTNYEGSVSTTSYDGAGNAISSTVASGTSDARTTQARYDAQGQVVQQLTAQGSALITGGMTSAQIQAIWNSCSIKYTYDPDGHLASQTDELGNTTYYYYDADGHLVYTVNGEGEVQESDYNALGELTGTIRYVNRISTASLTGGLLDGLVAARLAPNASEDEHTSYSYTLTGQVASTATAAGAQTANLYDAFGDITQTTQTLSSTQSLVTEYRYDGRGLVTEKITDPSAVDEVETNQYDAFGRLVETTDGDGNTVSFTYDQLGQLVATESTLGSETETTYDAFGRVTSVTDALDNKTTYTYSDTARSVTVSSALGASVTTVHNREGQTASVTDADGNTTYYAYDANGNLLETYDSLGTLSSATYNAAGLLATSTDGNGIVTQIFYDAANRVLKRVVDPAGLAETTAYVYDGEGRVTSVTDARGVQTTTGYDNGGRITSSTIIGGNAGQNVETTYSYDDRGDIVTEIQGAGSSNPRTVTYTYDDLGRQTGETVVLGLAQGNAVTQTFYDADGNVTRVINPDNQSTWYVYNGDGELTYTIDALGGVTQTLYDADHRLISTRRLATPISTSGFGNVVTLAQLGTPATSSTDRLQQTVYDADGRAVYTIDPAGDVTQNFYDANGNVLQTTAYAAPIAAGTYTTAASVAAALRPNAALDHTQRTIYDARNRAAFTIDALGDVTETLYDADGNITQTTGFAKGSSIAGNPTLATMTAWASANASSSDRTTRYWYDSMDRAVLTLNPAGYLTETVYNDAGLTKQTILYAAKPGAIAAGATTSQALAAIVTSASDEKTLLTYDGAGQIVKQTNAVGGTESFVYDAVGNKIQYTNENGAVWNYVYDGNHRLIEEQSPAVNVTTVSQASGGALTAAAPASESLVTYMTYDAAGNVLSQTEAYGTAQARTTSYQYDALGRQIRTTFPPMSVYNPSADAASRVGSAVVREDTTVTPFSQVIYNTLGDAVVNEDTSGNYTHNAYDQLGRLIYQVDDLDHVTAYTYDAFGNQTSVTRYANPVNLSTLPAASAIWSLSQISAALQPNASADRTVLTSYDLLNRKSQVTQPTVTNYLSSLGATSGGGTTVTAGAATLYDYDAFGDLTRTRQLVNPAASSYAATYYYYDQRGLQIASVDPMGYLTTDTYDAFGNKLAEVQYAAALTSLPTAPGGAPPSAPAPGSNDRQYAYTYDALNRLLTQTLLGVTTTSISGSTTTASSANQVTTYQYDGVGNQIAVTNALGATTYTYYDALGRITAIASPAENLGNGTTLIPLTVMARDAFGDLVSSTEYAAGAATATASGYTIAAATHANSAVSFSWTSPPATRGTFSFNPSTSSTVDTLTAVESGSSTFSVALGTLAPGTYDFSYLATRAAKGGTVTVASATGVFTVANGIATLGAQTVTGSPTGVALTGVPAGVQNRVTLNLVDSYGRVLATQDPDGNPKQTSYDVRGDVAKTWQLVTNPNDGSVEALVTINAYDALGELKTTTTPERLDSTATEIAVTTNTYDAFGDLTSTGTYASGTSGTAQVYYDYDQAGRLWATNSGDGVDKVYLYDLEGDQTAEITSDAVNLSAYATAAAVLQSVPSSEQKRTETVYDADGQAIQQRSPSFSTTGALEPINGSFGFANLLEPVPPTAIYQAVTVARGKGGSYTTYVVNPTTWANNGGYIQVSAPTASNPLGTYARAAEGTYQLISQGTIYWNLPTDRNVSAAFVATNTSTGAKTTLTVNQVSATQLGVSISTLPSGSYTYAVTYTRAGITTPYAEATGSFTVANSTVISLVSTAAPLPDAAVTFTWTSSGSTPDFAYVLAGGSTYTEATPVQNGSTFSVALGTLAPGTYDFIYDTYQDLHKVGYVPVVTGSGSFTVANGVATLVSQSTSVGTATNVAVSSNIPAVATPTVVSATVNSGVTVTWEATNIGATATLQLQLGSGAWTSYGASASGSDFVATAASIAYGTYHYKITEVYDGEIVSLGTGTLTYSAASYAVSNFAQSLPTDAVGPLSASFTSVPGNPSVTFGWTSAGTSASFAYGLSSASTAVTVTQSGSNFTAKIGTLANGTYDFAYTAWIVAGKGGHLTEAAATGTFSVSNGTAKLVSQTITVGSPTNVAVTYVAGPSVNTTTIKWAASSDTSIFPQFFYRVHGTTTYTQATAVSSGGYYVVTLPGLAAGTYDYEAQNCETVGGGKGGDRTEVVDQATGTFVVTATSASIASQQNSVLETASASGSTLAWTQAPNAGDSVYAYAYNTVSGVETQLTPVASGASYTASLAALPSGSYTYYIYYYASGATSPYLSGSGTFTFTDNPTSATLSTPVGVSDITSFLDGGSGVLYWNTAASSGSTITFNYRLLGATTWAGSLPVSAYGSGYSVNLSSLAGTIEYEVTYTAAGATTPYVVANGRTTINRTGTTSASLTDTTATTLAPVTVTPLVQQTLDRWGDLTSTTDASGDLTRYAYNQLGKLTQTTLPAEDLESTAGGTITDLGVVSPTEENYYNVLGQLIGTRDGDGNLTSSTYNADGLQLTQSNPDGGGKQFIYDAFGDQIQVTEAVNGTTSYRTRNTYDGDGDLTATARELNAGGFLSSDPTILTGATSSSVTEDQYSYDGAGRRTSATNGDVDSTTGVAETTRYWYDLRGLVTMTTTPLGYATTYQYDLKGNQTLDTNADGDSLRSTYDYFGHLLSQTDLGGEVYTYTYNADDDAELAKETSTIAGAAAQNIQYQYDAAGHLIQITDTGAASAADGLAADNRVTNYTYDAAGRESREVVTVAGLVNQDTHITYDQQNRIYQLNDISFTDVYRYDQAGNRTEIKATYVDYAGNLETSDLFYTYDAMNRVLLSQAADVSGKVAIDSSQGIELTYDWIGDRLSATQYGQVLNDVSGTYTYTSGNNTQDYTYDGVGDLLKTTQTELTGSTSTQVLEDVRSYDNASRLLTDENIQYSGTGSLTQNTIEDYSTYDDDGNLESEVTYSNGSIEAFVDYGESTDTSPTSVEFYDPVYGTEETIAWAGAWTPGYDPTGVLRGYVEEVWNPSTETYEYDSTDSITYRKSTTYQETGESITSTSGGPESGATTYGYDVDNQLVSFVDSRNNANDRSFENDQSGDALTVVQGQYGGSGELTTQQAFQEAINGTGGYNTTQSQRFFYALGQQVGSFGQLANSSGTFTANFDVNYTPVSQAYPAPTPNQVVALQGDTLQTIAARLYGDANLWYIIAQENGLTSPTAEIAAGTVLRIPNQVISLANTAESFKPYNAADAIGNTTPTQPIPPPPQSSGGGGCGILGEILVFAVAVIVSLYVGPEAGDAIAGALGTSVDAGTVAGDFAAAAGGVIGGAAGSVASQGVGIAIGEQNSFSWTAVAEGAIQGGVTAGVNSSLGISSAPGAPTPTPLQVFEAAGLSSAITQGIEVATGLQKQFSWQQVALSAVAAPIASAAGSQVTTDLGGGQIAGFIGGVANGVTSGLIKSAGSGHVGLVSILTDAFGNALGNSVVSVLNPPSAASSGNGSGNGSPGNQQGSPSAAPPEDAPQETPAPAPTAPITVNVEPDLAPIQVDTSALENMPLPYIAQPGDSISSILGTSNPAAIAAFLHANSLPASSTIYAGQLYVLPTEADYANSDPSVGQQVLNQDNAAAAQRQAAAEAAASLRAQATATAAAAATPPSEWDSDTVNNLSLGANGASGASVTAPAQPPTTALSLLERFGDGVINTLESAVTQPVLQVHDLLAAGASVVYNETIRSDNQPYWFPTLYSGVAAASDAGVSQTSLLLQSNPITGAGVVTYNLTTAALNGNWGDVAEQSGGLLAGLAIGKAVDAYGDYNVQSPIVPVGPGEMGMFGIKDLQSPLAPPIPDDLVDQLDLPPTTQRALLRDALGAEPGDGYQAHHVIPLQAINTFPDLMAQGAEGGFDINGANNGVLLLPSDHEGGHPVYNSVVLNQLATIDPELSPSETAQQLQGISDKLRAAIDAGTFGPWQ